VGGTTVATDCHRKLAVNFAPENFGPVRIEPQRRFFETSDLRLVFAKPLS